LVSAAVIINITRNESQKVMIQISQRHCHSAKVNSTDDKQEKREKKTQTQKNKKNRFAFEGTETLIQPPNIRTKLLLSFEERIYQSRIVDLWSQKHRFE